MHTTVSAITFLYHTDIVLYITSICLILNFIRRYMLMWVSTYSNLQLYDGWLYCATIGFLFWKFIRISNLNKFARFDMNI